MTTFNRGLNDAFVTAFNREYDTGGWLRRLVDDKEVFLAIREQYVNFYYRGCSLLRLACLDGNMVGQVHYKYLLRADLDHPYITVCDGRPEFRNGAQDLFLHSFADIGALKQAAEPYVGSEKAGVHHIVLSNPNILDVEIAFRIGRTTKSAASAPRVDFAAIRDATVVLYEAKHFNNHELRAEGNSVPRVAGQIETYRGVLEAHRDAVISSYRRVCCNLLSLHGMAERHPERHAMLKDIASGPYSLELDPRPKLVVFGYDTGQWGETNWQQHHKKLNRLLDGRFLHRGNSKGFVRGISQ